MTPPELHDLAPSQIPEWFAYQLAPDSAVYNISFNHFFMSRVDRAAFHNAWQQLLDRHDVFRLRMAYAQGRPKQYLGERQVLDPARLFIERTTLAEDQVAAEQERLARDFALQPFDFEQEHLYRLHLVAYPDGEHQLIFTVHHIIWDETSTLNLIREFATLYSGLCQGRDIALPALKSSFLGYAQRTNAALRSGELEVHRDYWLRQFANLPAALQLPTDRPRPVVQTYNGNTLKTWLPRAMARDMTSFCARHNSTLFMLLLATLNLYFYRTCAQDDMILGCPLAGRDASDQPLLGCFAVPMPIRTRISADMSFSALLSQVGSTVLEAFEHYRYPCVNMIEQLSHQKDLSRPKLFSVMAGVQNNKSEFVSIDLGDGELYAKEVYAAENHGARFDLAIGLDPVGSDIKFFCTYNSDLFDADSVERMLDSLETLIEAVIDDPGQPLPSYPLLSREAARQVLKDFNPPLPITDPSSTALDLIDAQCQRHPGACALSTPQGILSYAELAHEVDRLARALVDLGVVPGDRVGVLLEAGAHSVIALLAILRLGAVHVPLHEDWPQARREAVTRQVGFKLMLGCRALAEQARALCPLTLLLDHLLPLASGLPRLASRARGEQLAYLLFTSGSTGQPKGIPIAHAGVHALLSATQARYQLQAGERLLFWTACTFDASLLDMLWPLSAGAQVVPWPAGLARTPENVLELLERERIGVLQTVPAMLDALVTAAQRSARKPAALRLIICGAAVLSRSLANRGATVFGCQLVNHYGPTEATVDALWFDCAEASSGDRVPIGRPLPHVQAYVLDRHDQLLPVGVPGQLCLASTGLSPGYWQAQEQTQQAFFDKALAPDEPVQRLYRSGDIARFDAQGRVHYIGRLDNQVKVRGNRVELGDIETALCEHPAVAKAAVLWQEGDQGGRLRAFVELRDSHVQQIEARGQLLRQFSVAQRPALRAHMNLIHHGTWPRYFAGSQVLMRHWEDLYRLFPQYQFCLVDTADTVACVANGIPLYWDGHKASVPSGWDAGLELALHQHAQGVAPNTVLGLAGIVAEHCQGQGLSSTLVRGFRALARQQGLEHFLGPVRPVGMSEGTSVERWAQLRDEHGEPLDFWLRTHLRLGARELGVATHSQRIEGTVAQWQDWSGVHFDRPGAWQLDDTLQSVQVDLQNNLAVYYDPSIWVAHSGLNASSDDPPAPCDPATLRHYLSERLPAYMLPDELVLLGTLPLTENGKLDTRQLQVTAQPAQQAMAGATNPTQQRLLQLWQQTLHRDDFGIDQDFFLLGGQSLQVIEMLSGVEQAYGLKVRLQDFYREPSIRHLERLIQARERPCST